MKVIYQIKELKTNKIYIGSTLNYKNRQKRHISTLINNTHHNVYLQRLFNKHRDINLIEFTILEKFNNNNDQFSLEQKWIENINPELNIGSVGGGDNLSLNPNKERICRQISDTLKLKYSLMSEQELKEKFGRSLELNPNWKNGIYLEKTTCKCGNKKSYCAKVCSKCYNKTGKNNPFFGKKHNQQTKEKLSKAFIGRKPINSIKIIIDNVLYNSATEASKILNCTTATILNRCKSDKFNNYNFYTCPTTIEITQEIEEESRVESSDSKR